MERYSKILAICKRFCGHNVSNAVKIPKVGRPARLDDVEITAQSLYQEEMGYCRERDFFIFLIERHPEIASKLGTRRNYNNRRRKVAILCEKIRQKLSAALRSRDDSIYLVDSMPLPMCRQSRRKRCRIMQEREVGQPLMGRCAAQNEYYYGYKLHAVCTLLPRKEARGVLTIGFTDVLRCPLRCSGVVNADLTRRGAETIRNASLEAGITAEEGEEF